MEHRRLANAPFEISPVGLGCMGMSEFYGPRDDVRSMATLGRALELGVNFFDTADMYGHGHNERLLGDFMRASKVQPVVATKFGIVRSIEGSYERRIDNSSTYVRAACEASLKRLGVEAIDLYFIHRIEPGRPIEEVMDSLGRLVTEGKVRAVGICEPSAATLRRAHAEHPIAAVQSEYSLWSRDCETDGVLDACHELAIDFVAYSPMGRGFLAGTIQATEDLDAGDIRKGLPRFRRGNLAINLDRTETLRRVAAAKQRTPAQVALAWLFHKGVVPIPGARRNDHLEDNVDALLIGLEPADLAALDAAFPPGAAAGARYTTEGFKGVGI